MFSVFDVLLAVNMCIYSFFYIYISNITYIEFEYVSKFHTVRFSVSITYDMV